MVLKHTNSTGRKQHYNHCLLMSLVYTKNNLFLQHKEHGDLRVTLALMSSIFVKVSFKVDLSIVISCVTVSVKFCENIVKFASIAESEGIE